MTRRLSQRSPARGFTLVELMVAITGGLFMSVIVFALARDGSRFYQQESRVADATLAAVSGFERLRGDLARAGFMASPNIQHDPSLCQERATFQGLLADMAALRVERPDATGDAAANGLTPDQLLLSGNYTTFDQFPMKGLEADAGGAGFLIDLMTDVGPMARRGYITLEAADQSAYLAQMFPAGRALRITTGTGSSQYAIISGVVSGNQPQVRVSTAGSSLTFRGNDASCGLRNVQADGAVNVVNFVQYSVRSLSSDTSYARLYTGSGNPYDSGRTELVRAELNPLDGSVIAGSEEIVAEYVVNLSVGLTVAQGIVGNDVRQLLNVEFGSNDVVTSWAGLASDSTVLNGPHRIRSVRVRLAVRSREPDRDADIVGGTEGPVAPGLYRVGLGEGGGAPFARVRTVQADLALNNLMGLTW